MPCWGKKKRVIENCNMTAPGGKHKQLSAYFHLITKLEFKMSRWCKKPQWIIGEQIKLDFFLSFFKHELVVNGALLKADLRCDLAQSNKKVWMESTDSSETSTLSD